MSLSAKQHLEAVHQVACEQQGEIAALTKERDELKIKLLEVAHLKHERDELKAKLTQVEADAKTRKESVDRLSIELNRRNHQMELLEADAAAMRDGMGELVAALKCYDVPSDQFSITWIGVLLKSHSPGQRLLDELATLRDTAKRRLDLLRDIEGPLSDVAAFGNCDCDIPNGKTCLTCQLALLHKRLAAELKDGK